MASKRYSESDLQKAIVNSISWRQVCDSLGLKYAGGNVANLKRKAKILECDYSHFRGQGWNLGGEARNSIPLSDCLKKNGHPIKPSSLKKKLIREGLIETDAASAA